jgi:hypothetical protein
VTAKQPPSGKFKCRLCGEGFASAALVSAHYRRDHPDAKPERKPKPKPKKAGKPKAPSNRINKLLDEDPSQAWMRIRYCPHCGRPLSGVRLMEPSGIVSAED